MRLLRLDFSCQVQWATNSTQRVKSYFEMHFKFPCLFVINVMNVSFCYNNPITAIIMCIEYLCVKSSKYDALKERVQQIGKWKEL